MRDEKRVKEQERQQCVDFLVTLGILIPFNGLKLYHGRTAINDNGAEWKVKSSFNNADNSTGNRNVNVVSALSTSDYATAFEFATKRNNIAYASKGKKIDTSTSKVYRIVTSDKNALIFNSKFNFKSLTPAQRKDVEAAFRVLSDYPITEIAPIDFEDRAMYEQAYEALKTETLSQNAPFVTFDIIDRAQNKLKAQGVKIRRELLEHIGGAFNSKKLLIHEPKLIMKKFTTEKDPIKRTTMAGIYQGIDGPLSMEYVASWVYNNHIIGYKSLVTSVTVGKDIDNYMLFDTDKINTEKAMGDKLQSVMSRYSKINDLLANFSTDQDFMTALSVASPAESVSIMCHKGLNEAYHLPSGVWEKFLVGEHTETVLRVFDDSFGDEVPESLKPFMRFTMLIHDAGKGYANKFHGKNKAFEKQYTRDYCKAHVFKECKVKENLQELILFIIDEAQDKMAGIFLPHLTNGVSEDVIKARKNEMIKLCKEKLKVALGREATTEEVKGLIGICKTLLTCDGGAYTRYAVTRDKKTGTYYRNGNDVFTATYAKPSDLRGREIHFPENEKQ